MYVVTSLFWDLFHDVIKLRYSKSEKTVKGPCPQNYLCEISSKSAQPFRQKRWHRQTDKQTDRQPGSLLTYSLKTNEYNKISSPAGNWTPVSRVTGGDTNHYTTEELFWYVAIGRVRPARAGKFACDSHNFTLTSVSALEFVCIEPLCLPVCLCVLNIDGHRATTAVLFLHSCLSFRHD